MPLIDPKECACPVADAHECAYCRYGSREDEPCDCACHRRNPDEDECECGDYRHQHKDGNGACSLNGLGHGGAPACEKFVAVKPISCNGHERIYEDGSGYICRHCSIDMDDED